MRRSGLLICLLLISRAGLHSQCLPIDFVLPSQTCLEQEIDVTSTAVHANYEWDFCSGDLDGTPTASVLTPDAGAPFNTAIIEHNGEYFGFYTSRTYSKIYRLDFGTDINSTPTPVDLGNLGSPSSLFLGIEIVKEGGNYYGFVADYFNRVLRFDLGNSPANTPVPDATPFYENGLLDRPLCFAIKEDETGKYAFVAGLNTNRLVRIAFATSYAEASTSSTIDDITITGSGNLSGVSLVRDCDRWYGITTSVGGGQITKLDFDSGLADDTPGMSQITGLPIAIDAPGGVAAVVEGEKYYVFIQAQQEASNLYRIEFGSSMSNAPLTATNFGTFGLVRDVYGFTMYKAGSDWLVLGGENNGARIFKWTFPSRCFSDVEYSTQVANVISTNQVGVYTVSLTTYNASGLRENKSKNIEVLSVPSPTSDFAVNGICSTSTSEFTPTTDAQGALGYAWDFGDGQSSMQAQPSHQYAALGSYDVELVITTTSNGCSYSVMKPVEIYEPPVADFVMPAGTYCTNKEYTFANATVDVFDGHLSYDWQVDDASVSNQRDLAHTFTAVSDYDIKLVVSIPGCADDVTQTLTGILTGPAVGFSTSAPCEDVAVQFTNTTTGNADSFLWDFGNGDVSTAVNESRTIPDTGTYPVSLQATGTNGCVSIYQKDVIIYTNPVPDFSLDLPPFSCAGTPSQFHDLTVNPNDSNLQTWNWLFGDGSVAQLKDPVHVYALHGNYTVSLQVVTDKGCSGQTARTVFISQSPQAAFSNSVACVDKPVLFTAGEDASAKAWQWEIDNVIYRVKNPTHTFSAAGDHQAQLTITATNNCASTIAKAVPVPVVPMMDIVIAGACAGQGTNLSAVATGSTDPATAWLWNFGGGQTAQGQTTSRTFAQAGNYPVQVQLTAASGCVYQHSEAVTIHPVPTVSFTPTEEYGPSPLTVDFTNTSTGAATYKWRFADDQDWTSTMPSPEYTYTTLGTYHVTLEGTSAAGCSGTSDGVVHVIVPHADLSVQEFTLFSDPATDLTRAALQIRNNGNYPIVEVQLAIDLGSGLLLTEILDGIIAPGAIGTLITNSSLTFQTGGSGFVCVTATIPSDANIADNKQCISGDGNVKFFEPYPNPSNGRLYFQVISHIEEELAIVIVNPTGADVYSKSVDVRVGLNVLELDLSALGSGVHTVRLISPSAGTVTSRIVIQR